MKAVTLRFPISTLPMTFMLILSMTLMMTLTSVDAACASTSLTIDQKLELLALDFDHFHNNIVTSSDLNYDLRQNFDQDKDGRVSEEEAVAWWTCAYGDSEFFARFAYGFIGGVHYISDDTFQLPNHLWQDVPLDKFLQTWRQRYEYFQQNCLPEKNLTIPQMVDQFAKDVDRNHDGSVTHSEIIYVLSHHYDFDHDKQVTYNEWSAKWVCDYGTTVTLAYRAFCTIAWCHNQMSLTGQHLDTPFRDPTPVDQFKQGLLEDYQRFGLVGK